MIKKIDGKIVMEEWEFNKLKENLEIWQRRALHNITTPLSIDEMRTSCETAALMGAIVMEDNSVVVNWNIV